MAGTGASEGTDLLRSLAPPVAVTVAIVVGLAWYVTWATMDLTAALMMVPSTPADAVNVALFLAILVVMMVAMMLPAALPMILTYHGVTRLEAGRPTRPADLAATALFVVPYFLVWGGFGLAALLGIAAVGWMSPLSGPYLFLPAFVLVAAGLYQATRAKDVCLAHCQTPTSFMSTHWRSGRAGAVRMGLHHAAYCLGCCWLFMLALFLAGSMSLLWMGALSVVIFMEKAGPRTAVIPRAIGAALVVLGALSGLRALGAF